jgi:large-conductance mechanosensitive channel
VCLQDWITPLIGAIFKGANFWELSFELNGSTFRYGHFINELVMFMLVCLILYFGVVLPLNKVGTAGGTCSTSTCAAHECLRKEHQLAGSSVSDVSSLHDFVTIKAGNNCNSNSTVKNV